MKRRTTAPRNSPYFDNTGLPPKRRDTREHWSNAGRMSRIFCAIDIFPPAQNTRLEYRFLVSGAVLFSPHQRVASDHPPLSAGR
jgi:hypothetical protein